jgi:predicted acetyltransferase
MAKSPPPARKTAVTLGEANRKIDELRRGNVEVAEVAENLDQPMDPAVRVTSNSPYHKIDLRVDGTAVSGLTVVDFQQQIGGAVVRMGGIAGVWTHDNHRFRGYSRRVIDSSLRWMRREGFDVTMLFGIPSYYPKYGFAPAFPATSFVLALRDAETAAQPKGRLVDFDARKHLKPVLAMFAAENAGRTGPHLRDPRHWQPFRKGVVWGSKARCKVALSPRGQPLGYIAIQDEHLTASIVEIGSVPGREGAIFPVLLGAAAEHAWAQRLETLRFHLPEDHRFTEYCKPLGIRKEAVYRRDGAAMVRFINVTSTLSKLAPTLGPRLRGRGVLAIRTNLDDVSFRWRDGALTVQQGAAKGDAARLPQWALAQLVYGFRAAASLADHGVLRGPRVAIDQLGELFPVRPHFFHLVDDF